MKKIIIFSDWYLPAYKAGGPVRSIAGLTNLLVDYYDLLIFTSNKDLGSNEQMDAISTNQWSKHKISIYYSSFRFLELIRIIKIFNKLKPNYIYLNGVYSIRFTLTPLIIAKFYKNIKVVLSPRGMLLPNALKSKYFKKIIYIQCLKLLRLFNNVIIHNTTLEEEFYSKRLLTNAKEHFVVPNVPTIIEIPHNNRIKKEKGSVKLLFVGRINRIKGIDLLLKQLKMFTGIPIELKLVGPIEDNLYYEECLKICSELDNTILVSFSDGVPFNKLHKFYSNCHFFISPTLSENFGHSIFEALSSGTPVLINNTTHWRSLEMKNIGWDFNFNDEKDFYEILSLVVNMDNQSHRQLCQNAKEYSRHYVNGQNLFIKYKKMFK